MRGSGLQREFDFLLARQPDLLLSWEVCVDDWRRGDMSGSRNLANLFVLGKDDQADRIQDTQSKQPS
jgi:hypothetical protein